MARRRIIRLGYFEHPSYVPLLRRTYALWRELEAAAGHKLLHITGIAEIGPPDGEVVAGTLAASRMHGLPHEVLDAAETMRRFPAFRIPADYVGVVQPDGGFVAVEAAIAAHARAGAGGGRGGPDRTSRCTPSCRTATACASRPASGDIEARTAIVAAGRGRGSSCPICRCRCASRREVMAWFEPRDPAPFAGRTAFRCSCSKAAHGEHYGFPPIAGGLREDRQAPPSRRGGRSGHASIARYRPRTRR